MNVNVLEFEAFRYAEKKKFNLVVKQAYIDGYRSRLREPLICKMKEEACHYFESQEAANNKAREDASYSGASSISQRTMQINNRSVKIGVKIRELIKILEDNPIIK